jgi:hypothetical protein
MEISKAAKIEKYKMNLCLMKNLGIKKNWFIYTMSGTKKKVRYSSISFSDLILK